MDRNQQTTKAKYKALFRNRMLTIIIVSFTPMILISGIILYQFYTSYHEKVYAHLETIVKKHKRNIDSFLNEKLGDIRFIARTFSFEELSDESFLQDRLVTLQQMFGHVFVDMGVINEQGIQVSYAGPFKLGKALYSEADWFQKAMESEYVISDVFFGLRGLPHFIIAVRENHNGKVWILRSTIDFVAFNNLVENIRIGETGFAFILNREGKFQTKTLLDILPEKIPCMDFVKSGREISKEGICIAEGVDDSEEKYIYVGAFLKGGDWLLMFRQRSSDAFSDFRSAVSVTLAIILLGGLGIISMAFILTKMTVKRISQVEQKKRMMNEQIIETGKLASVGELAAGIAHEINNPVAIMVEEAGWIEDLLEEEEFKEGENLGEFKRALNQIRAQGHRCKEITHKLLSFARKTDSRVKDLNINNVIDELVTLSEQRARYSKVVIETSLKGNLPNIKASETELQQVFLNLINNAIDAMEKEGGTISIKSRLDGKNVVIDLADNGPGIPQANLLRIFDPFFTTKPVGKGTGLGLSICYGIIKKMGGEISVESNVGTGTTFHVYMPLPGDEENQD
ncbi:MAG: ATP-binding protein [Thermodesulfobacteriota bacterium]